jgi:hypothetical protein
LPGGNNPAAARSRPLKEFVLKSFALPALLALAAPAQGAGFNPVEFFRGHTHGDGILKVIFQASKTIKVDSFGSTEPDGALLLKQIIHEPDKAPRTRYWRMRQEGPHRFSGTLTDAAGPVRVDVNGDRVRIQYTGQNHLNFDQILTAESPRQVRNKMRVRRFGIIVAHFEEMIRKED